MRKTLTAPVILLAAVLLATVVVMGPVDAVDSTRSQAAEEQAFISQINALRTSHGLNALVVDDQLTAVSRQWAAQMKNDGFIHHAPSLGAGITHDWVKIGENVGVGGNVDSLMEAFIASPGHYANLVDPVFTHVGVGVVFDGNTMYTTHRFMALNTAAPPAPPPRPEPTPVAPPTTQPPVVPAEPVPPPEPVVVPAPAAPERVAAVLAALRSFEG